MWWVVSVTFRPHDPGTHWIVGWVVLRADLDTEARTKIFCLCRVSKLSRPACGLSNDLSRLLLTSRHELQAKNNQMIVTLFFCVFLQGLRKPTKHSDKIVGLQPEIWTLNLPHTRAEQYSCRRSQRDVLPAATVSVIDIGKYLVR
jgi:hypothetical protein